MNWPEAEAAIRAHIETQWALTAYAATQLIWENEVEEYADRYVSIDIEGTFAEKTIYGSTGKRSSQEFGIIYYHAFVPAGRGKPLATSTVQAMADILQLRALGANSEIRIDGSNPPSPVEMVRPDREIPRPGPGGMYYRCSGSVEFNLIGVV